MRQKFSVTFMLMGILFCVCLIASNLLETKIIAIGKFFTTAGLLIFPISYIINDCITEIWGFRKARLIIWCGFAMNFFVVAMAQIAVWLPSANFWQQNAAFEAVFALTPRIMAGSLVAFLVGSFLNAMIISKLKIAQRGKNFSLRAIVSTLAGETADSLIFFPIAFGGLIETYNLLKIMLLQIVLKSAYEILVLPITCKLVKRMKKMEQCDVFDENISYNPLKIKEI